VRYFPLEVGKCLCGELVRWYLLLFIRGRDVLIDRGDEDALFRWDLGALVDVVENVEQPTGKFCRVSA
jgi:hypothetical protein